MLASPSVHPWADTTVILDTNVIFNDPSVIFKYPGARIVVPGTVLEEIDGKKQDSKLGRAARLFSRLLSRLMKTEGDLTAGADLGNGSVLKVDPQNHTWTIASTVYDPAKLDNQILATALFYTLDAPKGAQVILISDDINMRIKAVSAGVAAAGNEYALKTVTEMSEPAPNFVRHNISHDDLLKFRTSGLIKKPSDLKIQPNQFVMLSSEKEEGSELTLARYFYDRQNPDASGLKKLADFSHLPIQPKNIEQVMLLDVLMDPSIHMVISESPAGTGKTFLAILAGLLQLADDSNTYDRVLVTRTLVQIGSERLGALPGGQDDKLQPWNENVKDALEALSKSSQPQGERSEGRQSRSARRREQRRREEQGERGSLKVESNLVHLVAFPHLRGRSIRDAFLILDEAQNASVDEVKTFVTRAGQGAKLVVLGDASQIDSPFLSESNNGLSVLANLVLNDNSAERSLVAHVRLTAGVRSELAEYLRNLFLKLKAQSN